MKLWIEKYKPENVEGIVGQNKAVGEVLNWLKSWKPGKALLLHGSAGTGKTLLIENLSKQNKWFLLTINASDSRSAGQIEAILGESSKTRTLFFAKKLILIDEVDGISPTDRGAVSSIIKIIKNSHYPVIVIANDPWNRKLQSLRPYCTMVRFGKVHSASIEKRLREICSKEGIEVKDNVLNSLAKWSQGDLRSAITDLQTVAQDKKELSDKDLEILGYRERESNIFEILPIIFKSRNINASRKAIQNSDKDPDEIFWWIENNTHQEFTRPDLLADAYNLLSKADIFRSRVVKQQNWRFKAFMVDLLSGISVIKGDYHSEHGFTPYKPPRRLIQLGATKQRRATLGVLYKRIGDFTHSSTNVVKTAYVPYLKIMLKKHKKEKAKHKIPEPGDQKDHMRINLNEEEIKMLLS
jgi:replication factor C large subunit